MRKLIFVLVLGVIAFLGSSCDDWDDHEHGHWHYGDGDHMHYHTHEHGSGHHP